jgi:hypothetical protein
MSSVFVEIFSEKLLENLLQVKKIGEKGKNAFLETFVKNSQKFINLFAAPLLFLAIFLE